MIYCTLVLQSLIPNVIASQKCPVNISPLLSSPSEFLKFKNDAHVTKLYYCTSFCIV